MLVYCLIFMILSATIYLYEEKHGKSGHYLSSMVLLAFIFFLLAGNYENGDTYNYEVEYNENLSGYGFSFTGYWGYYLLNTLCKALGMNYYHSRFVVYGIGFIALLMAFHRMNKNKYAALLLYMFFPMMIDGTQTRSFVAMALIALAITFLISGKPRDKIIFLVLIISAGGFHPICYVYLPLALCNPKKIEKRLILPVVLFSLVFANRFMSSILSDFVLSHLDSFSARRSGLFLMSRVGGQWVKFFATAIIIILVFSMREAILLSTDSTIEEKRFSNIVMYCALFSLGFLPFYFWHSEFSRLLRFFFPTFHMLFIMFLNVRHIPPVGPGKKMLMLEFNTLKQLVIVGYFMINLYMFYWDIYIFKDIVINPLFMYNSVF